VKEILDDPVFDIHPNYAVGDEFVMIENTAEEIRDVVEEFLNQPEERRRSELQEEFNRKWKLQFCRGLEAEHPSSSPLSRVEEKYRYACHVDGVQGAIGQKFLEQNWTNGDSALRSPDDIIICS
jgi:hypothetical protein